MGKLNLKECSLEEMEDKCMDVMGTPYGHNIIGIICQMAEERFGEKEADRLFDLYQQ